jgi:hypothetical protein
VSQAAILALMGRRRPPPPPPAPVWLDGGAAFTQLTTSFSSPERIATFGNVAVNGTNSRFYEYSDDGGATWTNKDAVIINMSLILMESGPTGRFYFVGNPPGDVVCRYTDTPSNGTWTTPTGMSLFSAKGLIPNDIAVGAGRLVAVYSDGDVVYCDAAAMNGFTRIAGAMPSDISRRLIWTGTEFVAYGQTGKVSTSPDGVNWTSRGTITATSPQMLKAACGAGSVVLSASGASFNKLHVSKDDGATWADATLPFTSTGAPLLAFAAGRFHAVSQSGANAAYSDDGGLTWASATIPNGPFYTALLALPGKLAAATTAGVNNPAILTV